MLVRARHCIVVLGLVSNVLFAGLSARAQASSELASPAFDSNVYKEGAIAQSTKRFGNWNLVCAEVGGLNRRFCNITTLARNKSGLLFVGMVISTTDEGKPAALLKFPLFVSIKDGIQVSVDGKKQKSNKKAKPVNLQILTCETSGCSSIWPLEQAYLLRLSQKGQLHIRIHLFAPETVGQLASTSQQAKPFDVIFDGNGFAEALQASQTP